MFATRTSLGWLLLALTRRKDPLIVVTFLSGLVQTVGIYVHGFSVTVMLRWFCKRMSSLVTVHVCSCGPVVGSQVAVPEHPLTLKLFV